MAGRGARDGRIDTRVCDDDRNRSAGEREGSRRMGLVMRLNGVVMLGVR